MSEVIDSLVTQLEYTADTKVIDAAEKKLKALQKQSKATATATDVLADEQLNLKRQIQSATEAEQKLRDEHVKIRKEIKATKKPTDDQRNALKKVEHELEQATRSTRDYRQELSRLGIQQAKIARQQRHESRQISQLGGAVGGARGRQATSSREAVQGAREAGRKQEKLELANTLRASELKATTGLAGVGGQLATAGPILAGIAVSAGAAAVAIGTVVETGARMESLRARLKTVEGGVEKATAAFGLLQGIAKKTPFELEDVTNAYVRMKSVGIQPTEAALMAFGNIAAAQGKPIIEFIEAVTDASTGEFERLKEFGIKASSQGDQVAFTFAGITTRVGKNAAEITKFLEGLGANQFGGAMADQMDTFGGLLSNLKDGWTSFLDQISQLGVLDEAKSILKELSGTMSDDLVPIIADVLIGLMHQLRDIFVLVRDSGGGLSDTVENISSLLSYLGTALSPILALWGAMVEVFQFFVNVASVVADIFNSIIDAIGRMLSPLTEAASKWEGLNSAWEAASNFGSGVLGVIDGVTASLFSQAEAVATVKGELLDLQKQIGEDVSKLTDAQLNELRIAGGESGTKAEAEQRKRIKAREISDAQEERAQIQDKTKAAKAARASEVASDFDKLSDRKLAAFASDPNVSAKLREKAEKEQDKRAKKKSKKGAAAGKKMFGATLFADIDKQIEKNARELAQAETARGLRSGKLDPSEAASFETRRFKEMSDKMKSDFSETGKLPAGIAQDVRQIAALPSINDLAGRTAAPVISNTINNYEFHDNEFKSIVEGGTFNGSPQQFAQASMVAHRKMAQKLLGEAVPNFRTQELR